VRAEVRPVSRGRRTRVTSVPAFIGTGIVLVALFTLAIAHALLITGQRDLDGMRRSIASETEEIRVLRLEAAELDAPARVLTEARSRFGMVEPPEVGYLAPLGAIGIDTTKFVRVDPATVPVAPVAPAPTPETSPVSETPADSGADSPAPTGTFDVGDGAPDGNSD
jgi:hypothetical protein